MAYDELADLVRNGLALAGLPIRGAVSAVDVRRLSHVYPLYRRGFEQQFRRIDDWLDGLDGVLTFGRQGLFAHDNTHHALYMAQAIARCLRPDGSIDKPAWHEERKVFETHVVED